MVNTRHQLRPRGKAIPIQKFAASTPMPKRKRNKNDRNFFANQTPISPVEANIDFPLQIIKEEPESDVSDSASSKASSIAVQLSSHTLLKKVIIAPCRRRHEISEPVLYKKQPNVKTEKNDETFNDEEADSFDGGEGAEIEDIYTNPCNDEESENDSDWLSNPYDKLHNFRLRNQSIDSSISNKLGETQRSSKRPEQAQIKPNLWRQPTKFVKSPEQVQEKMSMAGPAQKAPKAVQEKISKVGPAQKASEPKRKESLVNQVPEEDEDDDYVFPPPTRLSSRSKRQLSPMEQTPEVSQETESSPKSLRKRKSSSASQISTKKSKGNDCQQISPETSDEGIQSDLNDSDIKYIPKNDRYPLRARRYRRVFWMNSKEAENYRFEYTAYTEEEVEAEKELNKIRKEDKIDPKKLYKKTPLLMPNNVELLKVAKQLQKEKKQTAHLTDDKKKTDPSKRMAGAFNKASGPTTTKTVENQDGYDTVQFDNFAWEQVSDGVFHFNMTDDDKYIKILPGAMMPQISTGSNVHKILIMSGNVLVKINNDDRSIKGQGFLNIKQNQDYQITNSGDHDAFMSLAVF